MTKCCPIFSPKKDWAKYGPSWTENKNPYFTGVCSVNLIYRIQCTATIRYWGFCKINQRTYWHQQSMCDDGSEQWFINYRWEHNCQSPMQEDLGFGTNPGLPTFLILLWPIYKGVCFESLRRDLKTTTCLKNYPFKKASLYLQSKQNNSHHGLNPQLLSQRNFVFSKQ